MTETSSEPQTGVLLSLTVTNWDRHIDRWVAYMRAVGTPETTITVRRHHVQQLARGMNTPPAGVTFDDLVEWFAQQTWAPNTRRSYRTTFRAFWGWLRATGQVEESPAHLLPPIRIPRGKPRPIPEEAYRAALAAAEGWPRLAIQLAGRLGLRRSEVARSRRDDVEHDLTGWSLRVTGKGGHVRMVPLPDDLALEILAMNDGWLFPSPLGGHLTPHHLGKIVSQLLPGEYSIHTLRHRAGTMAYQGTNDLRAVQELLGHAKPETTALYTKVQDVSVRAAMEAAAA